jgi:hypothetical protein
MIRRHLLLLQLFHRHWRLWVDPSSCLPILVITNYYTLPVARHPTPLALISKLNLIENRSVEITDEIMLSGTNVDARAACVPLRRSQRWEFARHLAANALTSLIYLLETSIKSLPVLSVNKSKVSASQRRSIPFPRPNLQGMFNK